MKILFVNVLLFLGACSVPVNVDLGFNDQEANLDVRVIGAVSLAAQESYCPSTSPSNKDKVCAEGTEVHQVNDIELSREPHEVISKLGFKEVKIELPKNKTPADAPKNFSFQNIEAEFWAHDDDLVSRPSPVDVEEKIIFSESQLNNLRTIKFNKLDSCEKVQERWVCKYTFDLTTAQNLFELQLRNQPLKDLINVFTKGNNINTVGLHLALEVNSNIPHGSILTIKLTSSSIAKVGL